MATQRAFSQSLKSQMHLIAVMKDELYSMVDDHVSELSNAISRFETANQKHSEFQEVNSRLQKTLNFLIEKGRELESGLGESFDSDINLLSPSILLPSLDQLEGVSSDNCLESDKSVGPDNGLVQSCLQPKEMKTAFREIGNGAGQSTVHRTNGKNELSSRMTNLENRLNKMEEKFSSVQKECHSVAETEERFVAVEDNMKGIESKLKLLDTKLRQLTDETTVSMKPTKCPTKYSLLESCGSKTKTGVTDDLSSWDVVKEAIESIKAEILEQKSQLSVLKERMDQTNVKELVLVKDVLTRRVDDIEQAIHKFSPTISSGLPRVAFNVYIPPSHRKRSKGNISEFVETLCNIGSCYDPEFGVFTAPQDGLYAFALSLKQNGEGMICARVKHKRAQITPTSLGKDVCRVMTNLKDTCSSGVGVVALTAGDKVYAETTLISGGACLTSFSGFTGFLIGS